MFSPIDARFKHPFTCVIAGPSGCGKSTFVDNLLRGQATYIDTIFDYIYIFLGTNINENKIFLDLSNDFKNITLFEIKTLYPNGLNKSNFCEEFEKKVLKSKAKNLKGCVIFDDLMSELTKCNMLINLFTKLSSHASLSVVHITQNLFFKGAGNDNVTLFRNTKVLVLFDTPLDNTVFRIISQRMGGNTACLRKMLHEIVEKYRYVVIRGDFNTDPNLKFTSDIFSEVPFPNQKVFKCVENTADGTTAPNFNIFNQQSETRPQNEF